MVSSSSDEPTIDLNQPQCNFNPKEITGRSTATNDASQLSVEQILYESHCSDVRALGDELRMFKIRESHGGGEQLAYTADVSLTSTKSFRSSMSKPDDWGMSNQNGVDSSNVFMPPDRVKDFLKNEEHLWAQEYATLPPEPDYLTVENSKKKTLELSDFSRYRMANE